MLAGPAVFRRLSRRVNRPALFSAGPARVPQIISALQRAYHQRFSISAKASPSKPVKTGYAILDASLPSRKTAGLVTLRASRVNAAKEVRLSRRRSRVRHYFSLKYQLVSHPVNVSGFSGITTDMMRPRTIRIIALVLALMVCLTAFAGWDTVFEKYVTADWLSGLTMF